MDKGVFWEFVIVFVVCDFGCVLGKEVYFGYGM